jgi:hypothetical protein
MMQPQNWVAILLAAAAAWVFGAAYYGLLGNAWLAAQGTTKAKLMAERGKKSAVANAFPFVLSFAAEVLMGMAISGILFHSAMSGPRQGAISGALIWLGFVLTTIAVNNAYSGRSLKLTAIDAGHWLGALIIIGAVVGWLT